ncbi:MAG: flagellar brake protein [Gammaproteobacteria bacterium]
MRAPSRPGLASLFRRPPAVEEQATAQGLESLLGITAALQALQRERTVVAVGVAGSDEIYVSLVLEVVAAQQYLVLDALKPDDGNRWVAPGRRITVSAVCRGSRLQFESVVERIGAEGAVPYYRIRYPSEVRSQQRREHYRAFLPLDQTVAVQMLTESMLTFGGELRDISVGGLGMRLDPGMPEALRSGQVIPRCLIHLPAVAPICAPLVICYAGRSARAHRQRIGARFVDLDRRAERTVAEYVATLEREQARRLARY